MVISNNKKKRKFLIGISVFLSLINQLHENEFTKPHQTKIFGLDRPLLFDALKKEHSPSLMDVYHVSKLLKQQEP